jgi:hypothetical protein
MGMCVRCGQCEAPEPLGLCGACVIQTRVELSAGFRRLGSYLAAWAAFDHWLRQRPPETN